MNTEKLALWPGGPEIRQTAQAPVGTDAVLLADFAAGKGKRGIDLGCGSGILSLLLLLGSEALRMTGLELNAAAAALARENLERCGLSLRGEIRQGDIRRVRELFQTGSFDLAVSNPPYFPKGSGRSAPDPQRASAREEADCSLDELCAAAAYLLPTGGRLCVVYRPERLSESWSRSCCSPTARETRRRSCGAFTAGKRTGNGREAIRPRGAPRGRIAETVKKGRRRRETEPRGSARGQGPPRVWITRRPKKAAGIRLFRARAFCPGQKARGRDVLLPFGFAPVPYSASAFGMTRAKIMRLSPLPMESVPYS